MLVKNYFFLDETDGIEHLEDARNVYFSIKQESGESSVYHIQGIASLKKRNQYVKYLRGLSIYNFDKSGNLSSSMKVPYAKLIGVPSYSVEAADENIYKYKTVPFVLLKSIDRDTEGVFTKPVYTYEENSEKRDEAESMVLPMPLSDFNLISDASVGPDKMFLPSLLNFVNKCSNYGFSMEVFRQTLIKRISFPMFILIILVMSAVFAWNYRPDCRLTFHFKWFFVLTVLSFLIYEFLNTIEYILVLLSYMFVCLFGVEAIFVCIIVYIVFNIV